jgi:hypothetical protein
MIWSRSFSDRDNRSSFQISTTKATEAFARRPASVIAGTSARFEAELLGFLNHSFGADHLAIFGLDGERPTQLAAISYDGTGTSHERAHLYLENEHWRRDPAMSAVRQPSALDRSARACCMVCHP